MYHSHLSAVGLTLPQDEQKLVKRLTYCDTDDACRIQHWVETSSHSFANDGKESKRRCGAGSLSVQSYGEQDDATDDSDSLSSPASSNDLLVGCDDDLFIPAAQDINRTFLMAQHTWRQFVSRAEAIPPTRMPRAVCDPSIMLKDVPALPEHIPSKSGIRGVPVWRIRSGEQESPSESAVKGGTTAHGLAKMISLSATRPLSCRLSAASSSVKHRDTRLSDAQRGLGILTLCWSYILSMKLLELQTRKAEYSQTYLHPTLAATYVASPGDFVLDLSAPASNGLLRWLCALLAPRPGWCVRGSLPTWSTLHSGDVRFVILTGKPASFDPSERPPGSSRAAELLIEFCSLFGLGAGDSDRDLQFESMPPYTAAFLAALALPIYRSQRSDPQLPIAPLERRRPKPTENKDSARIRQYVADLRYYMTLSADTVGLQSILWSIFWQPDIQCNLVSPWLGGILDALHPLIEAGDVATLVNTFALRRPRAALWWLGILLLGSPRVMGDMVLWLETTEGRYGVGLSALSWPDITASAWTGSPNSFWDQGMTASYPNTTDMVSWADVLRCRFNILLQSDQWNRSFCWRPFGEVCKTDVEPDIWPALEQGSTREYLHWLWWPENDDPKVQNGFRRDTGRFVDIYDDLGFVEPQLCPSCNVSVQKRPSIVAVGRMLTFFMKDLQGGMAESNAALLGFESHKWHKYWNILPSRW